MKEYLDILGQLPGLRIYTQLTLCYAFPDKLSQSTVIETLQNGLERLSASFPWISGQVVSEEDQESKPGLLMMVPLDKTPRLVVKDLKNESSVPSMDDMRKANFPFRMLDESVIAPRMTLPKSFEQDQPTQVFLLQANFIDGGLLLTFVSSHSVMDMTGQGHIMNLLSKACHGEPFTAEEVSNGNLARYNLIPFLEGDGHKDDPEIANQMISPGVSDAEPNSETKAESPPTSTWKYFSFSAASLSAIKSIAMASKSASSSYISTDDALSAFIWKAVMLARLHRLQPSVNCQIGRAVDVRRYFGIPPSYPGLVQNMAYTSYTLEELINVPLGVIASQLRQAVDPKTSNLKHRTEVLATFIDQAADKSTCSFTASIDLGVDIMLSSWAKPDCYAMDFNLGLGKPEAVRRPLFEAVESLLYFMPRTLDGEIALAICLRDEDMERFKANEEVVKYSTYID